jgi:hypothetical protein
LLSLSAYLQKNVVKIMVAILVTLLLIQFHFFYVKSSQNMARAKINLFFFIVPDNVSQRTLCTTAKFIDHFRFEIDPEVV